MGAYLPASGDVARKGEEYGKNDDTAETRQLQKTT